MCAVDAAADAQQRLTTAGISASFHEVHCTTVPSTSCFRIPLQPGQGGAAEENTDWLSKNLGEVVMHEGEEEASWPGERVAAYPLQSAETLRARPRSLSSF